MSSPSSGFIDGSIILCGRCSFSDDEFEVERITRMPR